MGSIIKFYDTAINNIEDISSCVSPDLIHKQEQHQQAFLMGNKASYQRIDREPYFTCMMDPPAVFYGPGKKKKEEEEEGFQSKKPSASMSPYSLNFVELVLCDFPILDVFYHFEHPKNWWNDLLQGNNYKDVGYSGKMVLLLDILSMCSAISDKALVFSQSLSTLDLIELYLSKLSRPGKNGKCWKQGKDWYRLDGRTEGSERQKLVERFNEPSNKRVKCTLISTRAGSLGINLHAANRVVIVDGSWNPTYDLQAIYRVWRYGQTKPVFAYRLMAHGTMEEKIYKRQVMATKLELVKSPILDECMLNGAFKQVTKESLAARVVDRQQVHRTISKEEMLHLFDFGEDENTDALNEPGQENRQNMTGGVGNCTKQKTSPPHGSLHMDQLFESLLSSHYPRWIANYHEHESLLQENEDERLSKEEQDMAWEVYQRTLEWEEVQRVPIEDSAPDRKPTQCGVPLNESAFQPKPAILKNTVPVSEGRNLREIKGSLRNRIVQRKCTNLSHLLTLRSQGTKVGCSTFCGECAQEISWENLNREGGKCTDPHQGIKFGYDLKYELLIRIGDIVFRQLFFSSGH
ncbi:hypothetical protein RJ640_016206, partial [Escallonia rubra]